MSAFGIEIERVKRSTLLRNPSSNARGNNERNVYGIRSSGPNGSGSFREQGSATPNIGSSIAIACKVNYYVVRHLRTSIMGSCLGRFDVNPRRLFQEYFQHHS